MAIRADLPWMSDHDLDAAAYAAWPHLYAAALRHAADRIQHGTMTHTEKAVMHRLRRMADEATPKEKP